MTNSTTYNNYIAGEWVAGTETIENRNPSEPSDLIGLYAQADEKQLHAALAAAKAAQEKWADVGLEKRQSVLAAIGKEMIERSAELGEQLSREEGKPLAEGLAKCIAPVSFSIILPPKLCGSWVIPPLPSAPA